MVAIYNNTYEFTAYPYSILQKFTVDNKVMVMSHPEAVRKLHAWHTDFDRVLKRSAFIAYELNTSWDPDISYVFSRNDTPLSTIGVLIELPSFTADPSQRPPWSRCNTLVLILRPPP